jgi:hypothetical protein
VSGFDGPIEQFGRAVEAGWIGDIGRIEEKNGPLILRRQVLTRERIDVGRRFHGTLLAFSRE